MKTKLIGAVAVFNFLILANTAFSKAAQGQLDTAKIEQLTGMKGEMNEKEGVFTVRAPRTDLQVTTAGVKMNPAMGLTSYAAFMKASAKTMVMGDTTLLEDQVNPVMSVALDNGLEVTALHNHFFWDSPKVMFMHIGGWATRKSLLLPWEKYSQRSRKLAAAKGKYPRLI
jgi:Domain of Unknown Function (DUF1259)